MTVELQHIEAAAEALRGEVVATPCRLSRVLSERLGAQVYLKLENEQFTGSFKDRGALIKMLSLDSAERRRGVVAVSAGNHAQAVAYRAQRLGIPAVIVMPQFTPSVKLERTRSFGAEVVLHGDTLSDAEGLAHTLAAERDLVFVHPYDDERVIAGQGTVGLEMLRQCPELDVLLVPVGGGGLIAGVATAIKALRPQAQVIGVETREFPAVYRMLRGERPQFGNSTVAEGIAVKRPGDRTLPIIRERVDDVVLVDEAEIEHAVLTLLQVERTVVEGAGAAGLAALAADPGRFRGRRVGVVVSGGNIDLPILSAIIERGLVWAGRLVRLSVDIRDVPGSLARLLTRVGEMDASIVQVSHQRIFTSLPVQSVQVELLLQARGPDHVREIMTRLRQEGYHVAERRPE